MGDNRLVLEAREGNTEAFEVLMRRYAPVVTGFLRGRVATANEVDDLLQDVFLAAFEQLPKLKKPDRFGGWLVRIAKYKLADHYRRKKRERGIFTNLQPSELGRAGADATFPDPGRGPRERSIETETMSSIVLAMGRLSDSLQVIVYLKLWEGLSNEEIAARTGLAEGAIRTRLHRGLKLLRLELKRRGIEFGPETLRELRQST